MLATSGLKRLMRPDRWACFRASSRARQLAFGVCMACRWVTDLGSSFSGSSWRTLWIWGAIYAMSRPLFAGGSARQTSSGGFSIRHVLIRLFVAIRRFPGGHSSYDAARPTGATGPHPWASYPAVTGAAGETPVRRDESADDVFRNLAGGPTLGVNGLAEVRVGVGRILSTPGRTGAGRT